MPQFPYLYISLISFFTVVALYPDRTRYKILIKKFVICTLYKRKMLVTHVTFFGHASNLAFSLL